MKIESKRIFLDFIKKNKDFIENYNFRFSYSKSNLNKNFFDFISKNQNLVKIYMFRFANQVSTNFSSLSFNVVSTLSRLFFNTDRTFSNSTTSFDEADIDDDFSQSTMNF